MNDNKNRKKVRILTAGLLMLCMLTACGLGGGKKPASSEENQTVQENTSGKAADSNQPAGKEQTEIPEDSILNFQNDSGFARLREDMEKGDVPIECSALYDQGGSRPEVKVTDQTVIRELYEELAKMTVGNKSDTSVTDSYHRITFRLRNDKYVTFNFEGEDLFCWQNDNYTVTNGSSLWYHVRQLQQAQMNTSEQQTAKTAEKNKGQTAGNGAQQKSDTDASKTGTSSAAKSSSNSASKTEDTNALSGKRPEDTKNNRDLDDGVNTSGLDKSASIQSENEQNDVEGGAGSPDENLVSDAGRGKNVNAAEPGAFSGNIAAGKDEAVSDSPSATAPETSSEQKNTASDQAASDQEQSPSASTGDSSGEKTEQMPSVKDTYKPVYLDPASDMYEAYTDIIHAYADLLTQDKDTFRTAYDQGAYRDGGDASGQEVKDWINYELILDCFTDEDGADLLYGLRDYNEDGTPELVIVLAHGDEFKQVREIYSFDGKRAVRLFTGPVTLAYRVDLYLLPDNTFRVHGSGGATAGGEGICAIAKGGTGLEILEEYVYDEALYGSMDHISPTGETLTMEAFDEKYGDTSNPAEGIELKAVSKDAQVTDAPAADSSASAEEETSADEKTPAETQEETQEESQDPSAQDESEDHAASEEAADPADVEETESKEVEESAGEETPTEEEPTAEDEQPAEEG